MCLLYYGMYQTHTTLHFLDTCSLDIVAPSSDVVGNTLLIQEFSVCEFSAYCVLLTLVLRPYCILFRLFGSVQPNRLRVSTSLPCRLNIRPRLTARRSRPDPTRRRKRWSSATESALRQFRNPSRVAASRLSWPNRSSRLGKNMAAL